MTFTQAAHELRTPLASILGFTELLLKREFAPAESRELLEIVHAQAERMSALVGQVFDLARIESGGRAALRLAPTPVDGLLVQALAGVAALDPHGRVALMLAPGLPQVAADAQRLAQALANALDNSLRYSRPGTPVLVRASAAPQADGPAVLLEISDAGPGMTLLEQQRLFEPFWRGAREGAGTGLGMAIFKEIMDAHGAAVALVSAPGAGTVLTIRLPAAGGADA
jgi:signal transduction histidine kinase